MHNTINLLCEPITEATASGKDRTLAPRFPSSASAVRAMITAILAREAGSPAPAARLRSLLLAEEGTAPATEEEEAAIHRAHRYLASREAGYNGKVAASAASTGARAELRAYKAGGQPALEQHRASVKRLSAVYMAHAEEEAALKARRPW